MGHYWWKHNYLALFGLLWSLLPRSKVSCSLPTRLKLFDWKISNSFFSCMLYSDAAESYNHFLWECYFAQAVWHQAPFWNSFSFSLHIQFVKIIDAAIHKLQSHEFEILCVACLMIWNCHNKLIFENKSSSSVGLWYSASTYTTEFMEVNKINIVSTVPTVAKWSPPSSDTSFKMNIAISQS